MNQHFFITQPGNSRPHTAALLYYGNASAGEYSTAVRYWTDRKQAAMRFDSVFTAACAAASLIQSNPALSGALAIRDATGKPVEVTDGGLTAAPAPTDADNEFDPPPPVHSIAAADLLDTQDAASEAAREAAWLTDTHQE